MKNLVIIMGPCACGKSTLGRALLGDDQLIEGLQPFTVRPKNRANELMPPREEHAKYCINPAAGVAVAGDRKGGSDSINSRATLTALTNWLLQDRRVKTVITNSVRYSQEADCWEMSRRADVRPLYVAFVLTEEENLRRLLERRAGAGLTASMQANFKEFRKRAVRNVEVLRAAYGERLNLIVANDNSTTRSLVQQIRRALNGKQRD